MARARRGSLISQLGQGVGNALNRIFGIGWAKTGTTTLGDGLKILGYRHQGQDLALVRHLDRGDLAPILRVASRYESFEDWPWLLLFRELDTAFPGSRFVLTTREPSSWLASYRNMLGGQGQATERMNRIRRSLYGLPFPNVSDDALLDRFARHNREVREYFASRPSDLLVVDWARGHGWAELCAFLGRPVPLQPFPHSNRGHYPGRAGAPG